MKLDRFARYSWGVLGYNLFVILWGAYVRATGSGAGCGSHWPLCNGDVVPRAPALETVIEFTHRATSGVALVTVIVLFLWARRLYPRQNLVRTGALLSLVFIIIEALLGAGLVLFELVAEDDSTFRAFSIVAHLVNTFILVAVLTLTAWWASGGETPSEPAPRAHRLALYAAFAGLLVVGGTGAIAALGDTLFPAETLQQGLQASFSTESHPLVQLRKYHPLAAIFVGLYLVVAARAITRKLSPAAQRIASTLTLLYVAQLVAGTINIVLLAPVWLQIVHLLLADFVWIALVALAAATIGPRLETSGEVQRWVADGDPAAVRGTAAG